MRTYICVVSFLVVAACGGSDPAGSTEDRDSGRGPENRSDGAVDRDTGPDPRVDVGPRCADDDRWAFCESFDGSPSSPMPFWSPRIDVIVGENAGDAIIDGQTILAGGEITYGTIEAGYGPNCEPPNEMIRRITVDDSDPIGFQRDIRPQLTFVCNGRLGTVLKTGYGIISLMPRQLFDWSGRTGVIEFDANVYAFARNWWDLYLMPEEDMLFETAHKDEGGTGEQYPRRAALFSFVNGVPRAALIDDYEEAYTFKHWEQYRQAFEGDPAVSDPSILRRVRISISETHWKLEIEKQDGTFWTFEEDYPEPLTFSRAFLKLEHHSYNPTKDGIQGEPWSEFTYSWDNFRFDGPVIVAHTAFEPGPHFLDLRHEPDADATEGVMIEVDDIEFTSAEIIGHVHSQLNIDDVDAPNASHWRQVRVNDGPWLDLPLVKPMAVGTNDRAWSTFRLSVDNIVPGSNRIDFRYPARPPQATWQENGFRIKDVEIRVR